MRYRHYWQAGRIVMRMWGPLFALIILGAYSPANSQSGATGISASNLGKQITVEGWAVNRKIGAQLVGEGFDLWIDGLDSWPKGYYSGGDKGKKVRVSGVLAEDNGLPVYIPKKNEAPVEGIPVPEGTDLERASHRYLLKNANWELVEE